jgi:hypothetical protein
MLRNWTEVNGWLIWNRVLLFSFVTGGLSLNELHSNAGRQTYWNLKWMFFYGLPLSHYHSLLLIIATLYFLQNVCVVSRLLHAFWFFNLTVSAPPPSLTYLHLCLGLQDWCNTSVKSCFASTARVSSNNPAQLQVTDAVAVASCLLTYTSLPGCMITEVQGVPKETQQVKFCKSEIISLFLLLVFRICCGTFKPLKIQWNCLDPLKLH